jgi:general secretion pathway protein H
MNRLTAVASGGQECSGQGGFTLLEMVCVLAIVALLAAILLPYVPHDTTRPQLGAYAIEAAALLKLDRMAAIRDRRPVATQVNARARSLRSGATGRLLRVPDDVVFEALLPSRCNERPAFSSINFFPSGMSCGGTIALTRFGVGYEVRVNWLTGGVDVVPHDTF